MAKPTDLDRVFSALGDPTRRAILSLLRDDDATVGQLAHRFPLSQPAVSRHLRVLETAGLIRRRQVGTATISTLTAEPLQQAARYLAEYGEYWALQSEPEGPLLDTFAVDDGWII